MQCKLRQHFENRQIMSKEMYSDGFSHFQFLSWFRQCSYIFQWVFDIVDLQLVAYGSAREYRIIASKVRRHLDWGYVKWRKNYANFCSVTKPSSTFPKVNRSQSRHASCCQLYCFLSFSHPLAHLPLSLSHLTVAITVAKARPGARRGHGYVFTASNLISRLSLPSSNSNRCIHPWDTCWRELSNEPNLG